MEDRILQNLAIVASMERRHRLAQMEGREIQQLDHDNDHMSSQSNPITSDEDEPLQQTQQYQNESYKTSRSDANGLEIQSFSDTLRSKFNALSTRYVFLYILCL